jgi:uncharacterized protein YkwD
MRLNCWHMNKLFVPRLYRSEVDTARQVFALMQAHPQQGRKGMAWSQLLADIANAKCRDMAVRGYTGHVTPDGVWPNAMARAWGYKLPAWYSQDGNGIESLAWAGSGSVAQVWETWLDSPKHAAHILGLLAFFANQTNVGAAHYHDETSAMKHYWAILSVPPEDE